MILASASKLSLDYGGNPILDEVDFEIADGQRVGVVGENGSGKSTLLKLLAGLESPTGGTIARARNLTVGYLAQEPGRDQAGQTVYEAVAAGAPHTIESWELEYRVEEIVAGLGLAPAQLQQPVGTLSGGQQAQLALTLALAKRPALLLLDEPVASLDPLARREFLSSLMEAVADGGLTVVLSSHIVADLQRVCDHLIILSRSHVQLSGPIDRIVATHRILTGPRSDAPDVERVHAVVHTSHTERQTTLLVRGNGHLYDARWTVSELSLEEIVLAYLAQPSTSSLSRPTAVEAAS